MQIREKIEELIRDKRTQIPTLPVIVNNILKVAGDKDTSAKDLAAVIINDQAIANKTLRLANSSYYGLSSKVDSIPRAIAVIGFNEVIGMTIGMSVFSAFNKKGSHDTLDMRELWIHAIGCGTVARQIAKETAKKVTEQIYLAGLLHDMGKVILSLYFPEEYSAVLTDARQSQVPLFKKEEQMLGVDHAVLTGLLMERWSFPETLIFPCSSHHNFTACPLEHMYDAAIIQLADFLCHMAKIGSSGNTVIVKADNTLEQLGIGYSTVEMIIAKLKKQRSEIEAFLELIS